MKHMLTLAFLLLACNAPPEDPPAFPPSGPVGASTGSQAPSPASAAQTAATGQPGPSTATSGGAGGQDPATTHSSTIASTGNGFAPASTSQAGTGGAGGDPTTGQGGDQAQSSTAQGTGGNCATCNGQAFPVLQGLPDAWCDDNSAPRYNSWVACACDEENPPCGTDCWGYCGLGGPISTACLNCGPCYIWRQACEEN